MYTPKYASVAAWAKSIGSSAKTRTGQRNAIIASFSEPRQARPRPGNGCATTRAQYESIQRRTRQEKFAANHPLTLASPPPATVFDCTGNLGEDGIKYLIDTGSKLYYARVGGWYIRLTETVSWDNDRYSKSWHRAHGGVREVSDRTVCIRRVRPDGALEVRDVAVDAWRGNYLLNALVTAGVVDSHKGSMAIRLHPAYEISVIRSAKTLMIVERTLAGAHYDYCAVWHGLTFHASAVKAAIAGLRAKLHAVSARKSLLIDMALVKSLGFCDEGIQAFCREFDLNVKGRYRPEEIEEAVRRNVGAARPFRAELTRLAGAVGYTVPDGL